MSAAQRALVLLGLLCALGCGERRLIGRECPGDGCAASTAPLPECAVRLESPPMPVDAGEINRCYLFTLGALPPTGPRKEVYLTRAWALGHHLEILLAPPDGLSGIDAGVVDCDDVVSSRSWIPMMTTQGGGEVWDLSDAPLVVSPEYRIAIRQTGLLTQPGEIGVALNLECARTQPATVSRAFEFSVAHELTSLAPAAQADVNGRCFFRQSLLVSRLYRRTYPSQTIEVSALPENELVWGEDDDEDAGVSASNDPEWALTLDPPRLFDADAGAGLAWTCTYRNDTFETISLAGSESGTCSLFGFFQSPYSPDAGVDPAGERCTLE
jgi:hypothetical protein